MNYLTNSNLIGELLINTIKNKLIGFNFIKENGQINANACKMFKKHPKLLCEINHATAFIDEERKHSFIEKLHAIKNNTSEIPKCGACDEDTSFNKPLKVYNQYCSKSCAYKSKKRMGNIRKTMIERYGVAHALQDKKINNKKNNTMNERYGVSHAMHDEKLVSKFKQSISNHTEEETHEIVNQRQDTMEAKYGFKHALQCNKFKQQSINTSIERYGRAHFEQMHISDSNYEKLNNKKWLYDSHVTNDIPLSHLSELLCVDYKIIKRRLEEFNIPITLHNGSSYAETEIYKLLIDNCDYHICQNDRKQIKPLELDFYIPELKLAIEYCGIYWHSSVYKDKDYHYNKYIQCKEKGIRLITIFEDEWKHNRNIIEKFIINLVSKTPSIYGRKTDVKLCNLQEARDFLNMHHIQGYGSGKIKIGVYHNTKLVGVCIFKKQSKTGLNLVRFATNIRIVGIMGKIIKFIERNYDFKYIITYADNRISTGQLYINNNFKKVHDVPYDYYYVFNDKRVHKFNLRHKQLKNKLAKYDSMKTEEKNTIDNGINRIYDCGKIKYKLCLD